MKEILFRGFGTDIETWRYGFYCHKVIGKKIVPMIQTLNDNGNFGSCYNVDPSTIGRYSELCDKNGKRIFEGDIVRLKMPDSEKTVNGLVAYGRYTDVDSLDNYDYLGWNIQIQGNCLSILQPCADGIDIEVIGNAHENTKLIEKERQHGN